MKIAEVSKKYGVSSDTLRYYERIGLLRPVPRTASGVRDYGEARRRIDEEQAKHVSNPWAG